MASASAPGSKLDDSILIAVCPEGTNGEFCKTFIFKAEDHTLGNTLRSVISKYEDVQFVGYNFPHPSENIMHLRIQSVNTPATDILRKGLTDLATMAEIVARAFEMACGHMPPPRTSD